MSRLFYRIRVDDPDQSRAHVFLVPRVLPFQAALSVAARLAIICDPHGPGLIGQEGAMPVRDRVYYAFSKKFVQLTRVHAIEESRDG